MPGAPRKITRLTRQQAAEVAEVSRLVDKARSETSKRIREMTARARVATNAAERERLFGQISRIQEALADELDRWAEKMAQRTGSAFARASADDIRARGGQGITAAFSKERARRYLEMVHPDNRTQLAAVFTRSMAEEDIKSLHQAFVEVQRQSAVSNMTAHEIQKALQGRWNEIAGNIEFTRFVDRAGHRWDNARYLTMLVRTTTARVARESYIDTALANGSDLAVIENVGDSCAVCAAWGGVIVSMSGKDDRFPSYQDSLDAGMFHPNCDCLLSVLDEELDKEDIERQAEIENPDVPEDGTAKEKAEAVQEYSEQVKLQEKVDKGQTPEQAPIDLKRDRLKEDMQVNWLGARDANDNPRLDLTKEVDKIPDSVLARMDKPPKFGVRKPDDPAEAFYRRGTIYMDQRAGSRGDTAGAFHHEFGHHLHRDLGIIDSRSVDAGFEKAVQQDWKRFVKMESKRLGGAEAFSEYYDRLNWKESALDFAKDISDNPERGGLFFDTIGGASSGAFGWGHERRYYVRGNNARMEVFSNLYEAHMMGYSETLETFPKTWAYMRKALGIRNA